MLHLLKKQPQTLYHLDEQKIRDMPSAKLFRILLEKALAAEASAIVFGMPASMRPPEGLSHEWPAIWVPLWLEVKGALQSFLKPIPIHAYIQYLWNLDFLLVSLTPPSDAPPERFAAQLESFKSSSLEVPAPANRTPWRFVELPSADRDKRRFVHVTLHMAHDNTIHLQLHGTREEPSSIEVPCRL